MKVYCAPTDAWDVPKDADLKVVMFDLPRRKTEGAIGHGMVDVLQRHKLAPPARAWDLLSIALAIVAADHGCPREKSPDGWTREIVLQVSVGDPDFWSSIALKVEAALRFLTGDVWTVQFSEGRISPKPTKDSVPRSESIACLLSGGLDSLIGAIDLVAQGESPVLVSQVSKGDKKHQLYFANKITGDGHHIQLNHVVETPGPSETSQRARSFVFLAYGVLVASALKCYQTSGQSRLIVPENGFISLNVPLTTFRLGSLSTRTTHPAFIARFQGLLDGAGLAVSLVNPYQFKTKGEMLVECRNQTLLEKLAGETTSCGRYARNNMHCGRCVPCLIRRAAFHRWGAGPQTQYKYKDLSLKGGKYRGFDDVRAAAMAVEYVKRNGIDRWTTGALNSAQLGDISRYKATAASGLEELATFLSSSNVN